MAPVKTPKPSTSQPSTSTTKKVSEHKPHKKGHKPNYEGSSQSTIPGVQKVKAALRQTRRLLAKDKLAADVRVQTERRLRTLEKELAGAERARKERTMAQKYHKVKFFERQKVTRKLNQVKRQLEVSSEKEEQTDLKKTLIDLRVDLNYILNYPKAKKYISLFPPEARQGKQKDSQSIQSDSKGNPKDEGQDKADTDVQREEIRRWVREQMEMGKLSSEPELEGRSHSRGKPDAMDDEGGVTKEVGGGAVSGVQVSMVEEDEFFGDDSEEDDMEDVES